MQAREALNNLNITELKKITNTLWSKLKDIDFWESRINHIPITKYAFSDETETLLNKYLAYCSKIKNTQIRTVLQFTAFSVLEEISFTRKDGQYLRWDYRSKRELPGKPFDIGKIYSFEEAINRKLSQIIFDLSRNKSATLFDEIEETPKEQFPVNIIQGSCLDELPKLEDNFFDFIITSPPYCNRYDYTRTYALELIYLGYNNEQVQNLRQSLLSCTVENKEKVNQLHQVYESLGKIKSFEKVIEVYNNSTAMTEVNMVLNELNKSEKLNNNNIPRMVKNYFLEMCFVIYEMSRVLTKEGYCVMVNDNVRYGGEEIPVDLLLSEFAENFGFDIKKIFVLPKGKGNSSQQMGNYGRTEVRKCVYLWQKR